MNRQKVRMYGMYLIFSAVVVLCVTSLFSSTRGDETRHSRHAGEYESVFGADGTLHYTPEGDEIALGHRADSSPWPVPFHRTFGPNIRVDDNIHPEHREPAIAWGLDGALFAVYCERESHWNPEYIMFTRSEDRGGTWLETSIRVNDTNPNAVVFPAIEVLSDGSIVVAWCDTQFGPHYNAEIRFTRSTDDGETWSPSVAVHPIDPSKDYYRPSILAVDDRIFISFWDQVSYPDGYPTIVYSDDQGETWSDPQYTIMTYGYTGGSAPCIAYNETLDEIGLVMETLSGLILFTRSTDLGETWAEEIQVNDAYATSVGYPDISCGNGLFNIVWNDNRNGQYDSDVWFSRSEDGLAFTPSVKMNGNITGNQYEPHISVGGNGQLHVCWIWNLPFQYDIDLYYSTSLDQGSSWTQPGQRVNDVPYIVQPFTPWTADMLTDAWGNAYLLWNDGRSGDTYDNIYFGTNRFYQQCDRR